jgi:tetratricopeptide (TPR) repeat protein
MSSSNPMMRMQAKIRQNAENANAFVRDLHGWESTIRAKDNALRKGDMKLTKDRNAEIRANAPVKITEISAEDARRFISEKKEGNEAFRTGDYELALERYTFCTVLCPENPVGFGNRAQAYLKLGHFKKAEADCVVALGFDPHNNKYGYRRAAALYRLGDFASALASLKAVLQRDPKNGPARKLREDCLAGKRKAAQGQKQAVQEQKKATLQRKVELAPEHTQQAQERAPVVKARKQMIIEEVSDSDDSDSEGEEVPITVRKAVHSTTTTTSTTAPVAAATTPTSTPSPSLSLSSSGAATAVLKKPLIMDVTPSSSSSSSLSSDTDMKAPTNAYAFEKLYKHQQKSIDGMARLFACIPMDKYPALMSTALDESLCQLAFQVIDTVLLPKQDVQGALHILRGLKTVPRFSMIVDFIDTADAELLHDCLCRMLGVAMAQGQEPLQIKIRGCAKAFNIKQPIVRK